MTGFGSSGISRRTTIKWMLAAAASVPVPQGAPLLTGRLTGWLAGAAAPAQGGATGYGPDPDLLKTYAPGDLWPLTLSPELRRTVAALCDAIIPEDGDSPGASSVGVADFIDEWISAPYPRQREDRELIVAGLEWLDAESRRRFDARFAAIDAARQAAICDDICYLPEAKPRLSRPAEFFARYRDLTAGGFYTTPAGTRDLKYVGNVPMTTFDGPPAEMLRAVGLEGADLPGNR